MGLNPVASQHCSTMAEIWKNLKETFGVSDALIVSYLQDEIYGLKQARLSIDEYFNEFITLWNQLSWFRPIPSCDCLKGSGSDAAECEAVKTMRSYRQTDQVIGFLRGMNENYAALRSQVLLMDPLPSIYEVLSISLYHERQILKPPIAAAATLAAGNSSASKKNGSEKPYCTYCNRTGHTMNNCYKKRGFPPGHPRFNSQNRVTPFSGNLLSGAAEGPLDLSEDLAKLSLTQMRYSALLKLMQRASHAAGLGNLQPTSSPTGYLAQVNHHLSSFNTNMSGPGCPEDDW